MCWRIRASVLAGLVILYNHNFNASWKSIEQHFFLLILVQKFYGTLNYFQNILSKLLRLFLKSGRHSFFSPPISLLTPFFGQCWLLPAKLPQSFSVWRSSNITSFQAVIYNGKVVPKDILDDKYKITLLWFEYNQISSLISSLLQTKLLHLHITAFESLLSDTC